MDMMLLMEGLRKPLADNVKTIVTNIDDLNGMCSKETTECWWKHKVDSPQGS